MMQLLTVIRQVLIDDPAVVNAAPEGTYIRRAPQNSAHRSLVVSFLTGSDDWTQKGPMNFHEGIIRVACRTKHGDNEGEDALTRAVFDRLQNFSSDTQIHDVIVDRIFHRNTHDGGSDDKSEIQRTFLDFEVRYRRV